MGITRRTFIKGLGSGITALGLSDVILTRSGWAGAVAPAKTKDTQVTTSICPFCGVGCGLVANTKGGKLINVEGDPDHPINEGSLCSKGQAVFEVVTSPRRLQKVRYRAPGSDHWEEKSLDWAVTTLAQRRQGHPGRRLYHPVPRAGCRSTAPKPWLPSAAPPLTTKNATSSANLPGPWASSIWNIKPGSDTRPRWPRWGPLSDGAP